MRWYGRYENSFWTEFQITLFIVPNVCKEDFVDIIGKHLEAMICVLWNLLPPFQFVFAWLHFKVNPGALWYVFKGVFVMFEDEKFLGQMSWLVYLSC